ncbi:putative fatty acyl-CoA reductase CG5065 [Belonocnema kinseyi]|uniref:putative fatty acyl-CoA reductase CG5065 n=1 Tax=Belonocnema kinseyi TaxID=2817044 RepID=UPI00143D0F9D|nr:putative fatty acyl-CoA reductase CG5065 [Belonocnema kinseyi]
MSEIRNFYAGQNLFITGGTGYIGKILVEKLLRGCPEIGTIYLLIRQKRGKTAQERLNEMVESAIFEPLRKINPNFSKKILPINGDVGDPDLGLSPADYTLLTKEVSIVFHAAATIKFDDPLRVSVAINVNSVMTIIKICRECKNLKAAVYLSTAFSQCGNHYIGEQIYPVPLTYEQINDIVKIIEQRNFSRKEEANFTKSLLGKIPNTYVLTKSIAEGLLNEQGKDLPFCIFRFSIALATLKEPVPGWVDTFQGLNQTLSGIGLGAIHVIRANREGRMDLIPADFTCNAMIAAVWETSTSKNSLTDDLPVYNYVSGTDNPLKWKEFQAHVRDTGPINPPTRMIYYPDGYYVSNPILFAMSDFFVHFTPAILGDIVLRLMGRKSMLHKIYKRGHKLQKQVQFVTLGDWSFETTRVRSMWNRLSEIDKKLLPFDLTSLDWRETILIFWKGIMQYIVKDDFSPEGRLLAARRYFRLYVVHQIVKFFFAMLILWLTWKVFSVLRLLF